MPAVEFSHLPNELILQIATYADDCSLLSLLLCNSSFCHLLKPALHIRALAPRGRQSAIQWASNRGHITLVELLLARGMHPDTGASDSSHPALYSAVKGRRLEIAKLLLSHGADVNFLNSDSNYGYDSVIFQAAGNGDTAMITLLAAHGADVIEDSYCGMLVRTPLHDAVRCGHFDAVRLLLEMGALVNEEDSNGEASLEIAAEMASRTGRRTGQSWETVVEIGKLLVSKGARIPMSPEPPYNTTNEGKTAFKRFWTIMREI